MAAKYYAVRKGRNTGIYRTWDECKSQVFQYAGAEYKSFTTEQEALEYIGRLKNNDVQSESYAYVDGSFNIVTGVYGYGGFLVYNNEKYIITGSGAQLSLAACDNDFHTNVPFLMLNSAACRRPRSSDAGRRGSCHSVRRFPARCRGRSSRT